MRLVHTKIKLNLEHKKYNGGHALTESLNNIKIMSYLVLAYPEVNLNDYEWVEAFRRCNDELYYGVVEPHFSIVFQHLIKLKMNLLQLLKSM